MKKIIIISVFLAGFFSSCATTDNGDVISGPVYKKPGSYNFVLSVQDTNIQNPSNDRRCYYKIYIDKIDSGRTAIGLESQTKTFNTALSVNKHLIEIEKYILDEEQGKYVKVNNIYQPKPSYTYFDVMEDKIVKITVLQDTAKNKAQIIVDYEKD
ncbi:MAG: hypothetical protein JW982_13085 [Spirochaetes bacterium]|nr:hypothetical protein [Spirochaetota bacterium]